MRAIWIDATNKRIAEVDVVNLDDMQKAVGGLITIAAETENGDTLYVDDEGLLKEPQDFFLFGSSRTPFAGNGLILGCDYETGESIHAKISLDEVRKSVRFLDRNTVRVWLLINE